MAPTNPAGAMTRTRRAQIARGTVEVLLEGRRLIPRGINLGIDPMVYSPRAGTPMDLVGQLAITLAFDLPHRVPRWPPMVA
jgi:hypothetical protein